MVIDVIRGWDDVEGGDEHNASFSKGPIEAVYLTKRKGNEEVTSWFYYRGK